MSPWPRRIRNFPIIMLATWVQAATAMVLLFDQDARFATSVHTLSLIFPDGMLPGILFWGAAMAVSGFYLERKVSTLLCLIPQQVLLYLSAGGAIKAIVTAQYADLVVRSMGFIAVDQIWAVSIAGFHSWALLLILRHAADT